MSETKEKRAARYAGYERNRLVGKAPPLRVIISKEEGDILEAVKRRRGITKGGYPAALLGQALAIEALGGDAVATLESRRAELEAARAGKTQVGEEAIRGDAGAEP